MADPALEDRGRSRATLRRKWRRVAAPDRRRVIAGLALCIAIGIFTIGPLAWVLVNSFNGNGPGRSFDFTLDGWSKITSQPETLSSVGYSFLFAVRIPLAIVFAILIAWAMVRIDLPGRRLIESSLWLAFFLPSLPIVLGWILLADSDFGLLNKGMAELPFFTGGPFSINTVAGIIWVHISLRTIPIMVILLSPALRQFDASYEEASEVAGAGVLTTLRRITLPLLRPVIFTALLAGFIASLEVFEIEQILGTPVGITVYATRLFNLITFEPPLYAQALALGSMFLILLLFVALFYQWLLKRYGSQATITGRGVSFRRRPRTRWSYVISGAILTYISVGVFLPLIVLLLGSFNKIFGFFFIKNPWTTSHWSEIFGNPEFASSALNSLIVGLSAGIIGTLIYAVIAWVLVRTRIWGKGVINVLVWLPWAVPGVLAGVAWLIIFLRVPGVSLLYGTLVPLVIVLIVKELPLGTLMLRTSIAQVSGELEEAATVSGSGFVTTFRRITLPLIAPMLVSVFMLVFITTLRDVSTVVLLAPANTNTLPLLMFDYANSGRFESGAVIGVIMAAAALVIVSIAMRAGLKLNPGQQV